MTDETPLEENQPETTSETTSGDESAISESAVLEKLKEVIDPELMVNIVDLGLVYEVELEQERAHVKMTLTSPACPAGPQIMQQAKMCLENLEEIDEATIELVMSPPWTPERMTDDARDHLGIF